MKATGNDQKSTTPPFSPQKILLIDRYLDCTSREQAIHSSLVIVGIRTQQLQRELECKTRKGPDSKT
jgi:hypothetical protein